MSRSLRGRNASRGEYAPMEAGNIVLEDNVWGPKYIKESTARDVPVNDLRPSYKPSWWSGTWYPEWICFLIAMGCLGAIVGLLVSVEDKPVPDWPSGISINAVLSVLVTVMKGAMAIVISECMSQVKWMWFRKERRLGDLKILDEASRGTWGASALMITMRSWWLAYIGSFIFLVAFVVGPTVQQCVEIRIRSIEVPDQAASVPVCNQTFFDMLGMGAGPGLNQVKLPTIGAIYDGILQTGTQSPITPSCPSGNCTFPPYQSMGFCHECTDISDQLIHRVPNNTLNDSSIPEPGTILTYDECQNLTTPCTAELPAYGVALTSSASIFNSTVDYSADLDPAEPFNLTTNPYIQDFTAILLKHRPIDTPPRYTGVSCHLRFCVHNYEGVVDSGTFTETTTARNWAGSSIDVDETAFQPYYDNYTVPADPCLASSSSAAGDGCLYKVPAYSHLALGNTLRPLLATAGSDNVGNRPLWESDFAAAFWGLFTELDWESEESASFETVDRAFASLANVLTGHARASSSVCGGASVAGTQWVDELYVGVRWEWLVPAAVVLALCGAFLVGVGWGSRAVSGGQELWKSNPFAYLVMGARSGERSLGVRDMLTVGDGTVQGGYRTVDRAMMVRFENNVASRRRAWTGKLVD